ncbi:2',3'-cyclic-nucleotide 2'-phosphodiesterase/5'-or 3'-nucleotidase, 5'-nucleotidase family [Azospirillum oryzae]|uniref:2',3'-cyclic-nucleotide 2'-phosphodiesterase/5'-or 3'-nucleotidase, 5'-nucleotidase family n=1 Tax=Azospirillum oryzae TaxID=286727 RepID=A0A1X7E9R1_9PROT|nr:5'-nucleotidase C-terminal domain-containing protein [Azospirillum oryzae]SMF29593.1 2',3'-cyclic-nucleotide 2'-phosphodiesterase/5'-or 3'-nucleotidase, 5'-nucleotidase family [Azospirillum oryzae]
MDTIGIFNGAAGGMRIRFGRTLSCLAASLTLGLGLVSAAAVLSAQAQQPDAAAEARSGKAAAETGPVHLTILYTQGTTELDETAGRGGMARLAGTIRQERAAHPNLLVLHGGQTLAPSVLAFYDQGAHIIDLLNGMTIDAMAALNREFHHGDDRLSARAFEAGFPIVTTNTVDRATGRTPDGLEDAVVLNAGPLRIGVMAATPVLTRETTRAQRTEFRDPVPALRAKAAALRADGVDLVVAMTGYAGDTHRSVLAARPADIVLYQDRNRPFAVDYDGHFLSATVGPQAAWVLALDLTVERGTGPDGKPQVIWTPAPRLIDSATVPPDPAVLIQSKAYAARLDTMLRMEVGRLTAPLDTRKESLRTGENAFANAVVDTLRETLDADVALINGGGVRGDRQYPADTLLTRRDIYTILPFHDVGVVLDITGQQLWEAVESGVSAVEQLQGRFPHLSNARAEIDLTRPPGQRLRSLSIGGKPVGRSTRYRLATSSFLAAGGDGYGVLAGVPRLVEDRNTEFISTQMIDQIARSGEFVPRLDGRMTVRR